MYNCTKCKNPFEKGTKFCSKCGLNLEKEFLFDPVCPKCGQKYTDGTKFCESDGTQLTSYDNLIPKCIKCGTIYSSNTKYCPLDGGAVIPEAFRKMAKFNFFRDNTSGNFPKAPNGKRFAAALLDYLFFLLLSAPGIIIISVFASLNEYQINSSTRTIFILLGIILIIPALTYSLIKDGIKNGQSWGKRIVGLMVVDIETNEPCNKKKSAHRALISNLLVILPYIDFLTMWIEPIMILAKDDGRKFADMKAKTQVIDVNHYRGI